MPTLSIAVTPGRDISENLDVGNSGNSATGNVANRFTIRR